MFPLLHAAINCDHHHQVLRHLSSTMAITIITTTTTTITSSSTDHKLSKLTLSIFDDSSLPRAFPHHAFIPSEDPRSIRFVFPQRFVRRRRQLRKRPFVRSSSSDFSTARRASLSMKNEEEEMPRNAWCLSYTFTYLGFYQVISSKWRSTVLLLRPFIGVEGVLTAS